MDICFENNIILNLNVKTQQKNIVLSDMFLVFLKWYLYIKYIYICFGMLKMFLLNNWQKIKNKKKCRIEPVFLKNICFLVFFLK